jgi:hypothetical protein
MMGTAPLASASPDPSPGWYNSSWTYRKQITIDNTKVENENFSNFPVLVSLTDSDLAAHVGKDNGDDILFTASDGITKLSHEIENFDKTTGTLVAWVKVPTLYDNENTFIYMYYGNSNATNQQNRAGVWNNSFKGVWHLSDNTVAVSDNVFEYGSAAVFSSSPAYEPFAVTLDSRHALIAYRDMGSNGYGTAVIATVSGTGTGATVSYGQKYVFNNSNTDYISATTLDSTHVFIAYRDLGNAFYGTFTIATISGNTITYGFEYPFVTHSITSISTTTLNPGSNPNKVIITYRDEGNSGYGTAVVATVSGNSVWDFSGGGVFNAAGTWDPTCEALTDSKALIVYEDGSTGGTTATIATLSGWSTLSYDPKYVFDDGTSYLSLTHLSDSLAVAAYKREEDGFQEYARPLSISGTTVTSGVRATLSGAGDDWGFSVADLDSTHIFITHTASDTAAIGTVSGSEGSASLSFGSDTDCPAIDAPKKCTGLDPLHAIIPGMGAAVVATFQGTGTANDSTTDNNYGTIHRSLRTPGKIVSGVDFDGSDNYINVPDADSLDFTTEMTVMAWVKLDDITATYGVANKSGFVDGEFLAWIIGHTDGRFYFSFREDDGTVFSSTAPTTGTWYHVAATYDGSHTKIYVNGVLESMGNYSTPIEVTDYPLYIGSASWAGTPSTFFDGTIDEVRVSNIARSSGWIKTEYNNQNSPSTFYSVGSETLAPPTLVSPSNGTKTNDNTPTLTWDNSFVADNWEIWIDNNSDYSSPEFLENRTGNTRTLPDENSLADDNYRWRVRGYKSGSVGNFSENWTFIVDTVPPLTPTLTSPENENVTDQTTLTFQWSSVSDNTSKTTNVSGVRWYELWVDNDSDFSSTSVKENVFGASSVKILTGETYYWKVRAWDHAGNAGTFSSTREFTIENFSLGTSVDSIEIMRGNSGAATVTVTRTLGVETTVTLSGAWVGATPSGVTPSFSLDSGTISFDSNLTFTTTSSVSTGTFTYRITALSAKGTSRTADFKVSVIAMLYSVDAFPRTISMMRLENATSNVSITFLLGIKESVTVSGAWVGTTPTGTSASFSPASGAPNFDSVLTFTTNSTATAGSFTFRVTGTSTGGTTRTIDISVSVSTAITITLTTDDAGYEKGQRIRISGTAKNPKNESVGSGTATISIVSGSWSRTVTSAIANGAYSASYFITFDNPEGTWTISVSAVDNHGNVTSAPENVNVTVVYPVAYRYYVVTFLSPTVGQTFTRGQTVTVTVQITEENRKLGGASVRLMIPRGDNVSMSEVSYGVYSVAYTLPWDASTGDWYMSVIGEKTTEGVFKAGASLNIVGIAPATLSLTLISPTKREFEAGEIVEVKVEARYSDGSPVDEGIIVVNKPRGENLPLTAEGGGVYGATYTIGGGEVGTWNIHISAVDAYGNLGSMAAASTVIVPAGASSYVIRYWPVVLAAILGLVVASAFVARGSRRARRLGAIKREKQEIERLRKEAALKYFKKGSIPRETYDNLIKEYATRFTNLDKEERILMDKMKKKKLPEKKHPRKKGR